MSLKVYVHIVLLLVVFCTISCRDRNEEQSVDTQMSKIESETGLSFPANYRLDHFLEPDYFIDPVWVAKVVIPVSSYESFKETLLEKPTDNTVLSGAALADSTSWWKPANVVLTKQYLADQHTIVEVVVSKEDEEYAVYIECAVF